jgi:HK97 family phage major capsid protein
MSAKALREKRGKIRDEIKKIGDVLHAESRAMTADERTKFEALKADHTRLSEEIRSAEEDSAAVTAVLEVDDRVSDKRAGRDHVDPRAERRRQTPKVDEETRAIALQGWLRSVNGLGLKSQHKRAMSACNIPTGTKHINIRLGSLKVQRGRQGVERRDMGVGTLGGGGALVPQGFSYALEEAMKAYNGPRLAGAEQVSTDSGNPMPWPTLNDTTNEGEWLGENTAVTNQDAVLNSVTFGAWKVSSKLIPVSTELMQDSAFDLAEIVGRLCGTRIGRSQGLRMTTGTGAGQCQGIVTGSVAGLTAGAATVFTTDELIRLRGTVDPAYRTDPTCGWMMNDNTLTACMLLKDAQGRPIFMESYREGEPVRLLGYPLTVNNFMADVATTTRPILFGAMSKFKIRDVGSIRLRRLDERYADKDQVGFVAFARCDSKLLDAGTGPIKRLTMA